MSTRAKLWLFAGIVLAGAGLALQRYLAHGISARDQPTAVEAFIARRLQHLAIPRAQREAKNPLPPSPEVLADGRAHFADHCAICHGNDGRGQTEIGQNLYPKAPDMRLPETQSLSDGELFYIIKNGIRLTGMPAWGEPGSEEDAENWELVHFIRHLRDLSPAELKEMEALNPISPGELAERQEEEKFLAGEESPAKPPNHHH